MDYFEEDQDDFKLVKNKAKFLDPLMKMTSLEKYEMGRDIRVGYKGFGQIMEGLNVQDKATKHGDSILKFVLKTIQIYLKCIRPKKMP